MRQPEDDHSNDGESVEVGLDTEATVACPHCGETNVIGIDPGGGTAQDYVEDCQVCCRPYRVRVTYDDSGKAEVTVDEMP